MENRTPTLIHLFAADGSTFTVRTQVRDGELTIAVFGGFVKENEVVGRDPLTAFVRTARPAP